MSWFRFLTPLSLCFLLTACGFHPMYSTCKDNYDISYPLKIATIAERNGQILRNYLVDRLTPEGACLKPKYTLEVDLSESLSSIGVDKDETTRRQEAVMKACIRLRDCRQKIVYAHSVKAINSFAVLKQNYYSDMVAENYAKKEALRLLAEKIRLVVGLFLERDQCEKQ